MYYRELEPKKRKEMLPVLCSEEPDDGANGYRRFLLEKRYEDPRDPSHEVDNFLFQCVNFLQFSKTPRFFQKKARRQILQILDQLGFSKAEEYSEAGEKALYWEIRNAAARYFDSCRGAEYKRMFGVMSSSDEQKRNQMTLDAWDMSRGTALRLGLEKELALWCRAVMDEHSVQYEKAAESYLAVEKSRRS